MDLSARLMTKVNRIEYGYNSQEGIVYMDEHCWVDMESTIRLFLQIDPGVQRIVTIAADKRDTVYRRLSTKRWQALPHDGGCYESVEIAP